MTKTRSTKRALILSVLSLVLCFTMMLGTTYAWFTDTVASANNIIKSGTLDVELYYQVEGQTDWTKVTDTTNVFKDGALWEPGYTEVVKLKVVNEGNLALKYQLGVNVASETGSVNVYGDEFKLSDYIKYGVVEGEQSYTRDEAIAAVDSTATALSVSYGSGTTSLLPTEEAVVTMVVYMPTTVDNVANHAIDADAPVINLGINLFATQFTYEFDSFDDQYDINSAAFSVDEANEQLALNKDVTLVNCNEPNGIIIVPADYTGTLTIVNSTVKSVQGAGDVNLVIVGNVIVNAKSDASTFASRAFDGSAITANGKLSVSGTGNLTAIAADVDGAFGIGGMNTTEISIKDVTIDYASGSYPYGVGSDTKYYSNAPQGGAAIGSGSRGAVIALDNVTVTKAIGGSKAAGIGARYWTGVDISIANSTILYVEGGVSAAGIGGSRVNDVNDGNTTINIANSTITAKGGAYGAGIGSGYDSGCKSEQPLCTINITDSTINATGGKYAAGVGTGYHTAALAGEIKNSKVIAASGEKWYKDTYTSAMDIGFGITDPAREGQQTSSKLIYNGTEITLTSAPVLSYVADGVLMAADGKTYYISNRAGYAWMDAQADNFFGNKTVAFTADIDFGGETITSVKFWNSHPTVDGQGHTLSNFVITDNSGNAGLFRGTFDVKNLVVDNATVTGKYVGAIAGNMYGNIDNCTVKNTTINGTYWQTGALAGQYNQGNVTNCVVEDCTINGMAAVGALVGIINETGGERKVENCTVTGCDINQTGSFGGDYDDMFGIVTGLINIENSTVYVTGCTFENNTIKGAASDVFCGLVEDGTQVIVG